MAHALHALLMLAALGVRACGPCEVAVASFEDVDITAWPPAPVCVTWKCVGLRNCAPRPKPSPPPPRPKPRAPSPKPRAPKRSRKLVEL